MLVSAYFPAGQAETQVVPSLYGVPEVGQVKQSVAVPPLHDAQLESHDWQRLFESP